MTNHNFGSVKMLNFHLFRGMEPGRGGLKACPVCLPNENLEGWSLASLREYLAAAPTEILASREVPNSLFPWQRHRRIVREHDICHVQVSGDGQHWTELTAIDY